MAFLLVFSTYSFNEDICSSYFSNSTLCSFISACLSLSRFVNRTLFDFFNWLSFGFYCTLSWFNFYVDRNDSRLELFDPIFYIFGVFSSFLTLMKLNGSFFKGVNPSFTVFFNIFAVVISYLLFICCLTKLFSIAFFSF